MPDPTKTISLTFSITVFAGIVWTILAIIYFSDGGLGGFFGGVAQTILVLLLECLVFAVVYRRRKRLMIGLLIPPALVGCLLLYMAIR